MIKRALGMHTLNITQGRFNKDGSHKTHNAYDLAGMDVGIDKLIATYEYEVIAVLPYGSTGYANTVLFYDKENDVTLAMTHINNLLSSHKVGHVYKYGDIMYLEGTKGNASGNHIHLEIGKGRQTTKPKDSNGNYSLKYLINIEEYYYIDENITKEIKQDQGYKFTLGIQLPRIVDLSNVDFVESNGTLLFLDNVDIQDVKGKVIYNAKIGEYLSLVEGKKITKDFVYENKWAIVRLPDWNWGYVRIDDKVKLEF